MSAERQTALFVDFRATNTRNAYTRGLLKYFADRHYKLDLNNKKQQIHF